MISKTSLVAQQTRLSEWAEQVRECKNRPQGMKIEEWCKQHGITKANYYWRLRKVREAYLKTADASPVFVQLPVPVQTESADTSEPKIVAVLKGKNQMTLEISDQASATFLNSLIGAMFNA
ncbi:MAG: IS66 family insertion sequence element accessory protein TnpB [Clostridiales bacterium]|nr:IS66 family insertion sequence element accessory protein TnpB [Clostridiales bacterium]